MRKFYIFAMIASLLLTMMCCTGESVTGRRLGNAEKIMEEHPDSALAILEDVDTATLANGREKARYALLMSMAMDKNHIFATDFKVLQPAIDYYLKKGTSDEKLKTLYYKGCIYQNKGDNDEALMTYLRGSDVEGITDSLTYARLIVAKSEFERMRYHYEKYIEDNLKAAKIYHKYNKTGSEINSYSRALKGALSLEDKTITDSLYNICRDLAERYPQQAMSTTGNILAYIIERGNKDEIRAILDEYTGEGFPEDLTLDIARGYTELNEPQTALRYFDSVEQSMTGRDSIRYPLLRSEAEERAGDYRAALESYKTFVNTLENYHCDYLFNHDLLYSESKYNTELESELEVEKRNRWIWLTGGMIVVLAVIVGLLYYRNRLSRAKRMLAEQQKQAAEREKQLAEQQKQLAEQEKRAAEQEKLLAEQENQKLTLERERQEQELQNLRFDKRELEELLEEEKAMAEPLKNVIRERLRVLNNVMAMEITSDKFYTNRYDKWVKTIRDNREDFIKSIGDTLEVTYPGFMKHIKSLGLDEIEMKYIWLLAIGLRVKDVGAYIGHNSKYNISSAIRQKLDIGIHDTNMRLYVQNLMEKYG